MKAFLGLVCGFVLTLAVFGSGLVFAAWLLAAKPAREARPTVSVAELWTKKARPVNKAAQNLERVPAEQPAPADIAAKEPTKQQPDPTVTGAIAPAELPPPHLAWCANRYRSYNPDDNSYMSYSGQQRTCVSPYLAADRTAPPAAEASYAEGPGLGAYAAAGDDDHVASCFSRYRSYRPEDNSYQPYSGGPRRQCE
ncbi:MULTISPECIES: BA14K family protein [Mesorhizobium]|uniref:Lectin-like protein BA14k n=1 Tax=Mesorhizobium opportunistum (strain LMG 24607 / HAMBI 3007 / WSM2075) TaxID=536019 RepID=F7YAK9_MESOW|nr:MULTISPECIES: BA14K family protein [Mesorhizobium]AEH87687.1 BA14K family protein [Mesorhizobium opportunistum WSM2075]TPN43634.1 BA14K family protein [Mesorhizobium sp. B1-1-9]TPN44594.1 BA14K family protein [Mesorhizobium sp. B1-1-7]